MTASSRWTSGLAFHLAAVGAAVGLGSIWRFPYLAGSYGGGVFIVAFIIALTAIATPLLVAEFLLGRRSRASAPACAGVVAAEVGGSKSWNALGILGTGAALVIMTYYAVIPGWVMAYAWRCASGKLEGMSRVDVAQEFDTFMADPLEMGIWHVVFVVLLATISAGGITRGIEVASKFRAPALLILLVILVVYALITGDPARGLAFAFVPDMSKLSADIALVAIGQAFYATGVGMAMMLAYGAYVPGGMSLSRGAVSISASILLVSILATLMVFPLVYGYDLDPAGGAELVFKVLPIAFAEMPGGRWVGTAFFVLLVLAALTPSIACLEPTVSWLQQRFGMSRRAAVYATCAVIWFCGLGSVFSFNLWSDVRPLAFLAHFKDMTIFDASDYVSANILLPLGAFITCAFVGWRLPIAVIDDALPEESLRMRRGVRLLVRYVCPLAIAAIFIAALT